MGDPTSQIPRCLQRVWRMLGTSDECAASSLAAPRGWRLQASERGSLVERGWVLPVSPGSPSGLFFLPPGFGFDRSAATTSELVISVCSSRKKEGASD